jgi:hypothetical protein
MYTWTSLLHSCLSYVFVLDPWHSAFNCRCPDNNKKQVAPSLTRGSWALTWENETASTNTLIFFLAGGDPKKQYVDGYVHEQKMCSHPPNTGKECPSWGTILSFFRHVWGCSLHFLQLCFINFTIEQKSLRNAWFWWKISLMPFDCYNDIFDILSALFILFFSTLIK